MIEQTTPAAGMNEMKQKAEEIGGMLQRSEHVVVLMHHAPDGDAVGSATALGGYLVQKGKKAKVIAPSAYPAYYHWLKWHEEVMRFDREAAACEDAIRRADLILCVDFNRLNRLYGLEDVVSSVSVPRILIDHHPDPDPLFDVSVSDPGASSTAQLIYELIVAMGDKHVIGKDIASALYAGLMTDTGCFKYASTDERSHRVAAELLGCGAVHEEICQAVYDNNSAGRLRLLGYCLSEKMQVLEEYNTVLISLSRSELQRHGYQTGDTEDLVNYGLSIRGMRLSVLITERSGEIKVSLRSKGGFAANTMAETHFNGGGHRNAAGGQTDMTLQETVEKFLSLLPQYKEALTV